MKTMGGKTVWHEIRSARMLFTQEEWGEYLRRCYSDPAERIVTRIGKYDFNDNDICLNPEVYTLKVGTKDSYGYYVTLKWVDCGNGVWQYGLDYSIGTGGGGFGVRYTEPNEDRDWLKGYPSEKECLMAACDHALEYINHSLQEKEAKTQRLKEMVREYKKSLSRPQVVQLSLF